MIFFNEPCKTTDIQRILLNMKILQSCFVIKQLHENRFTTLVAKYGTIYHLNSKAIQDEVLIYS